MRGVFPMSHPPQSSLLAFEMYAIIMYDGREYIRVAEGWELTTPNMTDYPLWKVASKYSPSS